MYQSEEGNGILHVKPWGKDQGDYVRINKEDYDPKVHTLYEPPKGEAGGVNEKSTKAEIEEALAAKKIDFNANATKAELLALLAEEEAKAANAGNSQ
jgi:hypothetical protein